MNETTDTLKAIGALQAGVDGLIAQTNDIDDRVRNLEAYANKATGAFGIILKLGAVLTVIGGGIAWLWDHVKGT